MVTICADAALLMTNRLAAAKKCLIDIAENTALGIEHGMLYYCINLIFLLSVRL